MNVPAHAGTFRPSPLHARRAFTLVELLVVMAIIGVLAAILLPVLGAVRRTADKTTCVAHLKQIVAATNLKANDNNGSYPNMCGYAWEPGANNGKVPWIADALAPYVSGTVGQDPTKLMRCPAAEKNAQESWLEASLYCHYRYNVYRFDPNAPLDPDTGYPKAPPKPLVGYTNAMVFFDTTYPNWTTNQLAHSPGGVGSLNVAYADGHVATLSFADFETLNSNGDGAQSDFFALGWHK